MMGFAAGVMLSAAMTGLILPAVEHFAHGEDSPTVGSSPMESRVRVHGFYPSVAEEFLFFHPHLILKKHYLLCCFVEIFAVVGISAHVGYSRNCHKHVVEPNSILVRTLARLASSGPARVRISSEPMLRSPRAAADIVPIKT